MKKLCLAILFSLSLTSIHAQYLLDQIATSPSVAYSLRLVKNSYTGPLVRIKVGTSFYDVYPDASTKNFSLSAKISTAIGTYNAAVSAPSANTLSSIITAGTTNATVAIWYDQSGNSIHVLSNNPNAKIIASGSINTLNGQPTISFTGTNSFLTSSSSVNYSAQTLATINAVAQNVASNNYISGLISVGDNGGWGLCYDPTNTNKGYWVDASGGNGAFSDEFTSDIKVVTGFIGTATNSSIYINSTQKGTKVAQPIMNGTNDKIYVGSRGNFGGRQFIGNISELFMFPNNLSSSEQTTLESSQSIFIPPTVTITSSATGAVCAGTSITFTATPRGYTTPAYQWFKNDVAISGATSSTYSSSSLLHNDAIKVVVVEGSASISTSNLVMNLDAGNSSSYTSGTIWTDLTGRGNNGTISSGITYNAANGGYFQFPNTGGNGIVLPASSNDFNFTTGDFAVELWVNANNNQGRLISLNSKSDFSSNALIIFPVADTYNSIYAGSLSATGFIWYVWHHVIYTRISGTVSLYIDGVLKSTATNTSSLQSNSATTSNSLGSFIATNGYLSYTGKMSIARIYKDAGLTSAQVISNYNAICSRYGLNTIGSSTSNSITTSITAGPAATITVSGDACINKTTLSTPSGFSSYTWTKDNVTISGATSNTYSPTVAGDYKVAVYNGTCSSTSSSTTISNCGVTADGKMRPTTSVTTLLSNEGGINFGTGTNEAGAIFNTTSLTTTTGTIGATSAVLGGVISATNAVTSSIGVIYSTNANFGIYSSTTLQSNIVAGTYTSTITGLSSSTTYFAKSFIVNKAGTNYGPVVSFTTSSPPIAVGSSYGGGVVYYILQSGDVGYDANIQHGLIAATSDQSSAVVWAKTNTNIGATAEGIGAGFSNTNLIIANQGNTGSYGAKIARDYNGGGYTDWFLPSAQELHKLYLAASLLGANALGSNAYYLSSTEYNTTNFIYEGTQPDYYKTPGDGAYPAGTTKTNNPLRVRAIRYF
jgi:hypothetical protein